MQWNCPKESIVEDSDLVIDGMPGQANPGDYQMLFDGSLKVWKKLTTSPCTLYIKHFREMFGYLIRTMMDMIILKKTQMKVIDSESKKQPKNKSLRMRISSY